jgi:hypothetical protein
VSTVHVRQQANSQPSATEPALAVDQPSHDVADHRLDFLRFCYRRRRVGWPDLYDEMCAVAARGEYLGWGYAELAERGVCFTLAEMPRLVALAEQVMLEERPPLDERLAAESRSLSANLGLAAAQG